MPIELFALAYGVLMMSLALVFCVKTWRDERLISLCFFLVAVMSVVATLALQLEAQGNTSRWVSFAIENMVLITISALVLVCLVYGTVYAAKRALKAR